MRIVSAIPIAASSSIEPCILLDVTLIFSTGQEIPVDLSAKVSTDDDMLLGMAHSMSRTNQRLPLEASDPNSQQKLENQITLQLALPLTRGHVNYLEERRAYHRKGNVTLKCKFNINTITSKAVLSYLRAADNERTMQNLLADRAVFYSHPMGGVTFSPQQTNMWILSGNGNRAFLEHQITQSDMDIEIGSGDWIHDYVTLWNKTKYIILEVPLPEPSLRNPTEPLQEKLNAALDSAKNASDSLQKGEWNEVILNLRMVWELLKKDVNIRDLLEKDGYTPDAATALDESVKSQFELASKFIHRLDKAGKKINPEIKASKEDAYLAYSFAASVLNLVLKKLSRLTNDGSP